MAFVHIDEEDGSTTVRSLTSGHAFQMPAVDKTVLHTGFLASFQGSVDALGELIDKSQAIESDARLSRLGKDERLEPLRAGAVETQAKIANAFQRMEAETADREAKLLAVPALDSSSSVLAIEDREIRDWLRSMPPADRLAALQRAKDDPTQGGRLMLAMLRSPIPMLDVEKTMAADLWAASRRASDPAEAFAIDNRRMSADWARRGLAAVAGMTSTTTGWSPDRILEHIVTSPNELVQNGYTTFGFNSTQAVHAREMGRLKAARAKRAA